MALSSSRYPPDERRFTVLIVDDEAIILQWLSRALAAAGYDVLAADDAKSARWMLTDHGIDAVILDVRLTGVDTGLDVLDSLRADTVHSGIPAIVLTGTTLTSAEERRIRTSRAMILKKPAAVTLIVASLDEMLGRRRAPAT